ncbi:hypothetical protein FRC11_005447 [Ceratobasidium sp. 423]|nr:hypothetical protein FRC11_005447 [Ceratobasidium sp. 423]
MGKKIWTYLNNSLTWKDDKTQGKSVVRQVKDYNEAVNKWEKDKGSKPNITERHKLSYSIYTKLSNQQQKEFRGKAMAAVKESQELTKIANLEEHAKFTQEYWVRLKELFKEGSEMAGIKVCTLVVHETEEGKTWVTQKLSEGIEGFSKLTSLVKSMDVLKEFLETTDTCLTRVIPPEEHFQFLHVPASPTTIHPSKSPEAHQEQVERDGSLVYILVFENEVTKCHQVGGMTYNQQAIDFANYLTFNSSHVGGACMPPLQWMSLPIPGPNIPTSVFFGPELACLTSLAELLLEVAKNHVLTIVEVTNAYQEHLPVAGTLYSSKVFQDEICKGDVIPHQPRKTLYGGFTRIVHIVCMLTQIYLNCLAVQGNFKLPEDILAGYNISCFPIHEHDQIINWMDEWIAVIKQKTKILAKTSPEHKDSLSLVTVRPTSKDLDHGSSSNSDSESSSINSDSHTSPAAIPTPSSLIPSTPTSLPSALAPSMLVAGPSKCTKGKQPQQACKFAHHNESNESDEKGPEIDFKAMDTTLQHDKSSDKEAWDHFNERFLEDDIFPPGNLVGLHE